MNQENIDVIVALIGSKEQFLQILLETGMSWWVSSVAFCAAIVVAIWINKEHLMDLHATRTGFYNLFMGLVFLFFLSIVIYGFWMIKSVLALRAELAALIEQAGASRGYSGFEFTSTWVGFLIGNSSFIILSAIWLVVWISLNAHFRHESESDDDL